MRSWIVPVLLSLFAASGVTAQVSGTASPEVEQILGRTLRERLDAYARGDATAWGRFVADDCLCGVATKAEILKEIAARTPNAKNWYGEISGLEVRLHGEVAVARYRVTEHIEISGQSMAVPQRRTETYARRGDLWVLIAGAETVLPQDPPVAKVDPKIYDAYAGRYQYAPGTVDTVTREGDRLMVQVTGQAKEELLPETETTFFSKGQDWRLIFVKDEQGRVTEVRFRQNGQDLVGKRLRGNS